MSSSIAGPVLVTGATGIVGWHLVDQLVGRCEVRALVRDPTRAEALLPDGVRLYRGDLTEPSSLSRAVVGVETVFHAAGMPEQWLADPETFHRVNAEGTRALVAAALDQDLGSFVHTSTIDVFEHRAGVPFDETRLASQPLATAYQRSKQAADRVVADAVGQGLPARFVHPSAVYGPSPSPTPGANDLIMQLAANKLPALPPGGMPVVHAADLARGQLAVARTPVGSRYILSDHYVTLTQLAAVVREVTTSSRRPPSMPVGLARLVSTITERVARWTGRSPMLPAGQLSFLTGHVVPDSTRARAELGWTPCELRDGIASTLAASTPGGHLGPGGGIDGSSRSTPGRAPTAD